MSCVLITCLLKGGVWSQDMLSVNNQTLKSEVINDKYYESNLLILKTRNVSELHNMFQRLFINDSGLGHLAPDQTKPNRIFVNNP